MKASRLFLVSAVLIAAIISISSCKPKEAKVVVTVLRDVEQIDPVDSSVTIVEEPLQGATVRVYFEQNSGNIDENTETDVQGRAEFEFENIAILDLDVTYLTQQVTRQSAIRLEEGETVDISINIDRP